MNEEEFSKEFPSLCGKDGTIKSGYFTTGLYLNDGYAIASTGIKEHCLDKQRAKKIIEEVISEFVSKGASATGGMKLMEKMFDRLELKDE